MQYPIVFTILFIDLQNIYVPKETNQKKPKENPKQSQILLNWLFLKKLDMAAMLSDYQTTSLLSTRNLSGNPGLGLN